jgi:hypothetical protein
MKRVARRDRGQASVELIGALPVVIVLGLVLLQLFALGYSAVLAGNAAEAGALAIAAGSEAAPAARRAVPGWSRAGMKVDVRGHTVHVRMRPPSPLAIVRKELEVETSASAGG